MTNFDKLDKSILKTEDLTLLNIIRIKSYNTFTHCCRVGDLCEKVFENNNINISKDLKDKIIRAAYIHDLGKAFLFFEYQNLPSKLTEDEKYYIDTHSNIGYSIIKNTYPKEISRIVLEHHYNLDQNPWEWSQFVSCLDIFDALTNKRAYRKALSLEESLKIVESYNLFGFKYLKNYYLKNYCLISS